VLGHLSDYAGSTLQAPRSAKDLAVGQSAAIVNNAGFVIL